MSIYRIISSHQGSAGEKFVLTSLADYAVHRKIKEIEIMKSSTRDQVEGTFHELKGRARAFAGKLADNPELEAEGVGEKIAGKVQIKIGEVKKVLGK